MQGRDSKTLDEQGKSVLQLENHYVDIVGRAVNDSAGGKIPEGSSEFLKKFKVMFKTTNAHNCYGKGARGYGEYWQNGVTKFSPATSKPEQKWKISRSLYFLQ